MTSRVGVSVRDKMVGDATRLGARKERVNEAKGVVVRVEVCLKMSCSGL